VKNTFEDGYFINYFLLNFKPFLQLVDIFLGFAWNSFQKQPVAAGRFTKEFCVNP
jgi:hypothetical protein